MRALGWAAWLLVLGCQSSGSAAPPAGRRPTAPATAAPTPAPPRSPDQAPSTDPSAERYAGPPLPRATVRVRGADGRTHPVEVEVAATPQARERGLMWRWALGEGKGMLFIFGREEEHSFWMRNTLISLDMIFIGKDQRIVGIVDRAEPQSLISRTVGKPSTYVLEVPGGWARQLGVAVGSTVELEGISMVEVVP